MSSLLLALVLNVTTPDLTTTAERSGFGRTGTYDEVVRLCADFATAYPGRARCDTFGTTPEGRPMLALVAANDGVLDAQAARTKNRPVVLFQGGIHAGEIDGKDAGFILLHDLLERKDPVLTKLTAVFVPVFNADGHERRSHWNRPNQNGPAEMGFRVTSGALNLNRDYMKADAPEMRALLGLLVTWDPLVYLDLHVTDGAQFQHDIAVLVNPALVGPPALKQAGLELRQGVGERLTKAGHLPITDFYPSLEVDDDPTSGFHAYLAPPRYSSSYWAQQNRLGVLVETHSWKDYKTRVGATRDAVAAALELTAERGGRWLAAAHEAEAEALAGKTVTLAYKRTEKKRTIDFRGYAYTREPSAISGGLWTRYDPTRPQVWRVPFFEEVQPSASTRVPLAGYVVPPAWANLIAERLAAHGIKSDQLTTARQLAVEVYHADKINLAKESFEGHEQLTVAGAWKKETRTLAAGSLFVPIAQKRARLVVQLFEPEAPDAFVRWGLFNAAFEQKEYMEGYVAEALARDMLAKDPALATDFADKLEHDPAFAASPEQRLDYFYRRSPYWDERVGVYPVVRLDAAP